MEDKTPRKRPVSDVIRIEDDDQEYNFKVSLPNGENVTLTLIQSPEDEMPVLDFVKLVRNACSKSVGAEGRREILWSNPDIYVEDDYGIKLKKLVVFKCFAPNKCHRLKLRDGVDGADTFKLCDMQPPRSPIERVFGRKDVTSPSASNGMLLLDHTLLSPPQDVATSVSSIGNRRQELRNDVDEAAIRIWEHERKLELLNQKKRTIEQGMCDLQALLESEALPPLDYCMNNKEQIERQIEEQVSSAASVISNMVKISQSQGLQSNWMQDIIGIVALLGTVADTSLSRIFAEYLGEDNMLAVVCKSYGTASALEQHEEHGRIDQKGHFYQIATELGKPINRRFLVICIEEISPYTGKIEKLNPQRRLDLPKPLLPTGKVPHGFLGYAVNLINLDVRCMDTRTPRGHGLRETLFYLLFGELQVYETREYMKKACSCIKHGAVSLDGGIMKANGVLSLGAWEPEICFPVEALNIRKEITEMKQVVEATCIEIERVSRALSEEVKEFNRKRDKYENFMKINKPVLAGLGFSEGHNVNAEMEN